LSAAWSHEYLDINGGTTGARLVNDTSSGFTTHGNALSRNWGTAGGNVEWHLRQNVSLFGAYDYQFGNRMTMHNSMAGVRVAW
jgi:outer membrane autotransporter protein